jgi:chromosome segregation ATPase
MDTRTDPKLVPAVVLLNELDNLLAQLRSMELDFKRAQAETDAKITALHSQIAKLESVRVTNEEEIASLWHRAEVQERALIERREAVSAVELALHSKIQSLQQDLAHSRRDLEECAAAVERACTEADAERQEVEQRLDARENARLAAQAEALETEKRLGAKIHELELQLADKQLLVEARNAEIAKLKTEITQRTQRLAEVGPAGMESHFRDTKQTPRGEEATPANRSEFDEQEKTMKIDDADKSAAGSATEFEESSASRLEQLLHKEIDRLTREAHERNEILQNRNDELVRVKSELDRLKEHDSAIESASSRAESTYGSEAERMRNEFQAQLALLQAELSQKEWALEEHQAEARGREQNLRQEIDSLRRQLAESESQKEHRSHDFVFGETQSALTPEPRFELTGKDTANDGANGLVGQRRWNSGFGSKRRWRA